MNILQYKNTYLDYIKSIKELVGDEELVDMLEEYKDNDEIPRYITIKDYRLVQYNDFWKSVFELIDEYDLFGDIETIEDYNQKNNTNYNYWYDIVLVFARQDVDSMFRDPEIGHNYSLLQYLHRKYGSIYIAELLIKHDSNPILNYDLLTRALSPNDNPTNILVAVNILKGNALTAINLLQYIDKNNDPTYFSNSACIYALDYMLQRVDPKILIPYTFSKMKSFIDKILCYVDRYNFSYFKEFFNYGLNYRQCKNFIASNLIFWSVRGRLNRLYYIIDYISNNQKYLNLLDNLSLDILSHLLFKAIKKPKLIVTNSIVIDNDRLEKLAQIYRKLLSLISYRPRNVYIITTLLKDKLPEIDNTLYELMYDLTLRYVDNEEELYFVLYYVYLNYPTLLTSRNVEFIPQPDGIPNIRYEGKVININQVARESLITIRDYPNIENKDERVSNLMNVISVNPNYIPFLSRNRELYNYTLTKTSVKFYNIILYNNYAYLSDVINKAKENTYIQGLVLNRYLISYPLFVLYNTEDIKEFLKAIFEKSTLKQKLPLILLKVDPYLNLVKEYDKIFNFSKSEILKIEDMFDMDSEVSSYVNAYQIDIVKLVDMFKTWTEDDFHTK